MSEMNFIRRNIPNFFTLLNLSSGILAVILSFEGRQNLVLASYFIFIAGVFDFFDGFAARNLKATSPMGKELDSLADLISFGLAPSVILYQLMKHSLQIKHFSFLLQTQELLILLAAFLIAIFSALRLAKFNVDERQTESFIGLATPASAMLIAAIPLIAVFEPKFLILLPQMSKNIYFFLGLVFLEAYIVKPVVLLPLIAVLSFLLVSSLPMFSLKFKTFGFEENKLKYIFLILSVLLFLILQILAVPLIFVIYLSFSIFNNIFNRENEEKLEQEKIEQYILDSHEQ